MPGGCDLAGGQRKFYWRVTIEVAKRFIGSIANRRSFASALRAPLRMTNQEQWCAFGAALSKLQVLRLAALAQDDKQKTALDDKSVVAHSAVFG
jgi:hypothetical protein